MYTSRMSTRLRELGRGLVEAVVRPTAGSTGPWSRLASILAPGDWIYRDAHYLVADLELDAAVARRHVPWPLRLAAPARAQLFTADFPYTTFGSSYREAGLFFDVVHRGTRAIYCPWMIVDDDVALIAGRELLGYPKKLGSFTWSLDGDRIATTASRRDHVLITMTGTLGEPIGSPPLHLGRPHRNVRTSRGRAVPKIVAFTPRERVIEVRRADLEVRVTGSPRDPLHELGLGRTIAARLHRVDLGGTLPLPFGIVSPLAVTRSLLIRSH
jgi:acetoacetate decarboxylase